MGGDFTRNFREELARVQETRACCRMAVLAGLLHTAGSFVIRGGRDDPERYEIRVATAVQCVAKLVYSEFRAFGAEGEFITRRERAFTRRLVYEVRFRGTPAALQVLNEAGLLTDRFTLESGINPRILKKSCCRAAFLRGCLMGSGSANSPQREAHLEIVVGTVKLCQDLAELLRRDNFHPGSRARRDHYVVYLKSRDEVAGLLAVAGAHDAALAVEEQAVIKEVRARANRLANCDAANTRRVGMAASAQLEAIAILQERGVLERLPLALREVASLRLSNPYLSLAELTEASGKELSRSAINHRLRRLVRLAQGVEGNNRRVAEERGKQTDNNKLSGLKKAAEEMRLL